MNLHGRAANAVVAGDLTAFEEASQVGRVRQCEVECFAADVIPVPEDRGSL